MMRQILFALGLQAVAATVLLGLGGWLVIRGQLTLGQLVAAELIVMIIVGSFAKLGKHMESFYDLLASVDKLGHLFDLPIEPHDKLFHLRRREPGATWPCGACPMPTADATGPATMSTFDLRPARSSRWPGRRVRQEHADRPAVRVRAAGFRATSSWTASTCGNCGPIRCASTWPWPAPSRSSSGTIDENVHLNRPHISALDVREALAGGRTCSTKCCSLPDGLNTALQTDGPPLSSSQALRLMLARAIVGHPRLLLIDGTLDALARPTAGRPAGSLTSAGRPVDAAGRQRAAEVIDACDRVVTLADGALAGTGEFEQSLPMKKRLTGSVRANDNS